MYAGAYRTRERWYGKYSVIRPEKENRLGSPRKWISKPVRFFLFFYSWPLFWLLSGPLGDSGVLCGLLAEVLRIIRMTRSTMSRRGTQ